MQPSERRATETDRHPPRRCHPSLAWVVDNAEVEKGRNKRPSQHVALAPMQKRSDLSENVFQNTSGGRSAAITVGKCCNASSCPDANEGLTALGEYYIIH